MSLITDLGLDGQNLTDWGVVMPAAMASAMESAQIGNRMQIRGVVLVNGRIPIFTTTDGRYFIRADLLDQTDWYSEGLAEIDWSQCQCLLWTQCLALIDRYQGSDLDPMPEPPQWEQIAGAGLGPVGAVDGWPVGAHVLKDGFIWVSRQPDNVNEPLVNTTSTWSRLDGTFVVPAGWQYQPDEEVTEDGGATWFRVMQATSQPPSASPSQYVEIDGPGGDPVPEPTGPQPWVQPTGGQDAYAIGDRVTHDNPNDGGAIWVYESKIAANTTEPGRDGTFDRYWEPINPS